MRLITFIHQGNLYGFPVRLVAEDRANWIVKREGSQDDMAANQLLFDEEFDFVMNDSNEALDWFQNNMNPEDVANHLLLILKAEPLAISQIVNEGSSWLVRDVEPQDVEGYP